MSPFSRVDPAALDDPSGMAWRPANQLVLMKALNRSMTDGPGISPA